MDKLNLLNFNIQGGLKNKKAELVGTLSKHDIDVAIITEIKMKQKGKFQIPGYYFYKTEKQQSTGGVGILVKNSIKHVKIDYETPVTIENNGLDAVEIILEDNTPLRIVGVYVQKLQEDQLNKILNKPGKTLVIGDFNSRHTNWLCSGNNQNGKILYNYLLKKNDISLNYPLEHTFYPHSEAKQPSLIDLCLSKKINTIIQSKVVEGPRSDHVPVQISITNHTVKHKEPKENFDFKNANWKLYREILNERTQLTTPTTTEEIDQQIELLERNITEAANLTIPKTITKHNKINLKLSDEARKLISERNKTRKKWQRFRDPKYRSEVNRLSESIKKLLEVERQQNWENFVQKNITQHNGDPWKLTKMLKTEQNQPVALKTGTGLALTAADRANCIADAFEKAHTTGKDGSTALKKAQINYNDYLIQQTITDQNVKKTNCAEIRRYIKKLANKKAPGIDKIHNILIKNVPKIVIKQLKRIFNATLKLNYFPSKWKKSLVIPIPKPGKTRSSPTSYRPISLLPTLSKIFERILYNRLLKEINSKNILPEDQFGFRASLSTTHQLRRITQTITNNFKNKFNTLMVALDIEKAFDSVWHENLLVKLRDNNISWYLVKILQSYLKNRTFCVKVENDLSSERQIPAGVPQGSILGPLLFIFYIADLPKNEQFTRAFYADDTALLIKYRKNDLNKAIEKMENFLITVNEYFQENQIQVNANKTEAVIFSPKRTTIKQIKFNNNTVTTKTSLKYLGLLLDYNLKFTTTITDRIEKANIARFMLQSLLSSDNISEKTKIIIYKACIRSILTYAAPVWLPINNEKWIKLQIIQNKVIRHALKLPRNTPIKTLNEEAELELIKEFCLRITEKHFATSRNINNSYIQEIGEMPRNLSKRSKKFKLPIECL